MGMIFSTIVFAAMVLKIIPMVAKIYSNFKVPLPAPTKILLGISNFITGNLLAFSTLVLVVAVLGGYWGRTDKGRLMIDRFKLNVPLFGPLITMYAVSKFA